MHCFSPTRIAATLCLSLLTASSIWLPAEAAQPAPSSNKNVAPGVEFTKIQDLNPEKRATNRPIKQKWAVVIGVSEFRENRLNDEKHDMDHAAREFYEYLVDPHGGRFAPDHVRFLNNSSANLRSIQSTLGPQWLGELAGPDDLVVVFVGTSSFPTTDGTMYLCAHDCALDNVGGTCLSMQDLMNTLKHNVRSDRVLLVLQACYSGAAQLASGAKSLPKSYNVDVEKVPLGKGYVILSSSGADERTWGTEFSHNLVSALRQEDGLVPLRTAFDSARGSTERDTTGRAFVRTQSPVMKSTWLGNDLILGIPPVEQVSGLPAGVMNFLSAESYYLKATNLISGGDVDAAIAQYNQAIKVDPKYADALGDLGAALWIKGDIAGAADMYQRAIAAAPRDGLFHANYARVLNKLGRKPESERELDLAHALNPRDTAVLTALAAIATKASDDERAAALLNEAVGYSPASADLHVRLSYTYARLDKTGLALEHAREAVRLDPKSATAQMNLGSALLLSGLIADALVPYKEAAALAPTSADAHYLLSSALERAGERSAAKTELARFVELCSKDDPRVATARTHLLQLAQ